MIDAFEVVGWYVVTVKEFKNVGGGSGGELRLTLDNVMLGTVACSYIVFGNHVYGAVSKVVDYLGFAFGEFLHL